MIKQFKMRMRGRCLEVDTEGDSPFLAVDEAGG
jgi:hypothetical protein